MIATLRADYLASVLDDEDLCAVWKRQSIELRALTHDELIEAITRPLEEQNERLGESKQWQPELLTKLANEVAADVTLLPLLQVTLKSLWRGGSLTLEHYRPIADALKELADAALQVNQLGESRGEAEQATVLSIFLDLVNVSLDTDVERIARHSVRKSVLTRERADRAAIVDDLVSARLLTARLETQGSADVEMIDIIHETLLTRWERLRLVIEDEREVLKARARLRLAAQEWQAHDRAAAYLLNGVYLVEAETLDKRGDTVLGEDNVGPLLDQSRRARAAIVARRAREARRQAIGIGAVAVVVPVLVLAAIVAFMQYRDQRNLGISRDRALSATAIRASDPDLSLMLAIDANRLASTEQARSALRETIVASAAQATVVHPTGEVRSARFSPNGKRIVTAGTDGAARVWNAMSGQSDGDVIQKDWPLWSAEFSPNGATIVVAGEVDGKGEATLWDVASRKQIGGAMSHLLPVRSAHFSEDGTKIVTASRDGTAGVWDASTGTCIIRLPSKDGACEEAQLEGGHELASATFDRNGARVVTASADGVAKIWRVATGDTLQRLEHGANLMTAAFNSDGTKVLTAGNADETVWVWDAASGDKLHSFEHKGLWTAMFDHHGTYLATVGTDDIARIWLLSDPDQKPQELRHTGIVHTAVFSPDDSKLLTASADHRVRVWDVATGELLALYAGHSKAVYEATFSADTSSIVSASEDGTARVWPVERTDPWYGNHTGNVTMISLSPDGKRLLTASQDGTAAIVNVESDKAEKVSLLDHKSAVNVARFSPDGALVVTGGQNGIAKIWSADGDQQPRELVGTGGSVLDAAFAPDGQSLVTATSNGVSTWYLGTRQHRELIENTEPVHSVAFSSGRQTCGCGGR